MSKPVYARILYDNIKQQDPDGGLYVWVVPSEHTILKIQALMKDAPFKVRCTTQYHCTVMYHHADLPESIEVPPDRPMTGLLSELVVWTEPDGENILVGLIRSEDLGELHEELTAQGLQHYFEDYTAHISLGKDLEKDEQTLAWINEVNEFLDGLPFVIDFDACLKGSSIS
jgi:hypothetical protein